MSDFGNKVLNSGCLLQERYRDIAQVLLFSGFIGNMKILINYARKYVRRFYEHKYLNAYAYL